MMAVEGELSPPATLIEHAAAVASEPEPDLLPSPMEPLSVVPDPESAAVRYERERIDKWIRDHLVVNPLAPVGCCRRPIIAGDRWKETSNGEARRARTIRLATMRGAPGRKRRRGRRWGSRAEPFRSERSRRMRGAVADRASVRAICACRVQKQTLERIRHPREIYHPALIGRGVVFSPAPYSATGPTRRQATPGVLQRQRSRSRMPEPAAGSG